MSIHEYIEPDMLWLCSQFENIPFGAVRPSEIEIILAYVLMYHNGDIEKSEYDIAEKYHVAESKALRLKTEFGKRYRKSGADNFPLIVAEIGKRIFKDKSIEIDYDERTDKIIFILTDPSELRALKRALDFNNIPFQGDFNRKMVKLSKDKFIGIFLKYYPQLGETLKSFLSDHIKTDEERKRIFNSAEPLDYKAKKLIAQFAPAAINTVFSFIPV
jgi:hypothetical protein